MGHGGLEEHLRLDEPDREEGLSEQANGDTPDAIAAIADAVDPAVLAGPHHDAAGAVINQHGFNLLWIGLTTTICAIFIWRGNQTAVFIAGLTGGLADVGYFLFLDLGDFVHFVLGTGMTLVSSTAILLSLWVWKQSRAGVQGGTESALTEV